MKAYDQRIINCFAPTASRNDRVLGPNKALRDALLAQLGGSVEMEVDAVTVSPQVGAQRVCSLPCHTGAGQYDQ